MPVARFQMPDGRVGRFEVPEGTSPEQAQAMIEESLSQAPAAVSAGKDINSIPRQLGLTARYGIEGLANAAQLVTEPIRAVQDLVTPDRGGVSNLVTGQAAPPKSMPLGVVASQFADKIGLPKPQGANERVVGDATRLVAGAGGMGGAASLARTAPGMLGQASQMLSSNMGQQLTSAAGAGLAGGASREAGGSPLMQFFASLGGGIAGGTAPGVAQSGANAVKGFVNSFRPQQLDVQVQAAMTRAGVDWAQLPPRVQQALRSDLADALNAGRELDPAAVRRLADFRLVGATPTRGMVSQDPVQITREMNLAKTGANSSDQGLQGLARVQNQNNATFIRNLDEAGALQGDPFRAGASGIAGVRGQNAVRERAKTAAYDALEALPGYRAPMGANPISRINAALGDEAAMPFMPKEISSYMESFLGPNAQPFTPQSYNNLQKMLSRASTSQDGNVRHAVSVAMRTLENTPVTAGNAVPAAQSQAVAQGAQDAISQLQAARAANRDWRTWQESARPIEAAVNGAQPDKFFQQFVLNGTLDDARAVAQNAPIPEVRNAILSHLKDKALNGATSEVGKFSQSAYNKAVNAIGERKLALFFSPEELTQIRAVGRVASYAQNQPVGSAVNNSNSGALLLGKGLDALAGFSNSLPVIGPMVSQPITNGIQGLNLAIRSNQAQNVAPGLLMQQPRRPLAQGLLLPGMAAGGTAAGLLAAP